jgi:hypothetical protein
MVRQRRSGDCGSGKKQVKPPHSKSHFENRIDMNEVFKIEIGRLEKN